MTTWAEATPAPAVIASADSTGSQSFEEIIRGLLARWTRGQTLDHPSRSGSRARQGLSKSCVPGLGVATMRNTGDGATRWPEQALKSKVQGQARWRASRSLT